MSKETKLTFFVNGKETPVNGQISHKYDSKGNLEINFTVGTTKLDKIKLKFENLNYVEEIKENDKKENTNNN